MSGASPGPGWWLASDGRWYRPTSSAGGSPPPSRPTAPGGWARFRGWPWWAQALVWLVLWPLPLVLLARSKLPHARRPWWALAAVGTLLWVGIGVGSQTARKTTGTSSAGPPASSQSTTRGPATTRPSPAA